MRDIEDSFGNTWITRMLFILLVLFMCRNAKADEHYGNFFTTQPKLEYVFDGLWTVDMLQTLDICDHLHSGGPHGNGYRETNVLLGPAPSRGEVVGYFLVGAAIHAAVTYELVSQDAPRGLIDAWEYVSIGSEAAYVGNNFRIGLRMKF